MVEVFPVKLAQDMLADTDNSVSGDAYAKSKLAGFMPGERDDSKRLPVGCAPVADKHRVIKPNAGTRVELVPPNKAAEMNFGVWQQ